MVIWFMPKDDFKHAFYIIQIVLFKKQKAWEISHLNAISALKRAHDNYEDNNYNYNNNDIYDSNDENMIIKR